MSKNVGKNWPNQLLKAVERSVEALPSDNQIKESLEAIDSLISFLQHLRAQLSQQPSNEVRHDVLKATTMLCNFLSSYNAKVLFASKPTNVRAKDLSQSASQIFQELDGLPLDAIQNRLLEDGRYSVGHLRALARYLNIGIDKNMRRDDLADAIFKRGFANPRAYNAIGGDAAKKIAAKTKETDSEKAALPGDKAPAAKS
jgi:hypothetical protein